MRKLSAKWVPKCLNADQKRQRCQSSEQLLQFFQRDPNDFQSRLVTIDETWLYHYDLETKQQSMEWRHSGSPLPKISECKNSLEIFWPQFFGIRTVSSSVIIFQRAKLSTRSITRLCWCNWRTFEGKMPREGHHRVLFLHNNAPAHLALATHKQMAYLGFQCLDQPPFSPDLVPSDYHLFPRLKKQLKGRQFSSDAEVVAAAETWLDGQSSEFFFSDLQKLELRAKKFTELRGEYVE